MKYKISSIIILAIVFSLWYGIAETYMWFMQGIYTLDIRSFVGVFQKLIFLSCFSVIVLLIFNETKINLWTIGVSGMISVFLKDLLYSIVVMIFDLIEFGTTEMFSGTYLIQLLFDNFIFGVPFMLASYLVIKERMK